MKATEQTLQQIERAIRKVADKFPTNDETGILTDVHLRVTQDTGELVAFDDDDKLRIIHVLNRLSSALYILTYKYLPENYEPPIEIPADQSEIILDLF